MTSKSAIAAEPAGGTIIHVYSGIIRLWHWLQALCICVLIPTGLLIAYPLSSSNGEASAHFRMGYIRFAHFAAGYTLAVLFLVRVYAALIGNGHSRELFVVPGLRRSWRQGLMPQIRWYLMIEPRAPKHIGHNPMGQLFMFVFLLASIFMMVTGFALYGEGAGVGSWQDRLFGWVIPLFGGSQAVHSWHHLGMWVVITFIIAHVYAAIREEILSRQSMLGAIVNGRRIFRD